MSPRRRAGETRHLLLQAGRRLLAEHGVEGVTTRAVTDAVEIRQPSFYAHFDSVDSLIIEVASTITDELVQFTDEAQQELRRIGPLDLDANIAHWTRILERLAAEPGAMRVFLRHRRTDSALGRLMDQAERATCEVVAEHVRENLRGAGRADEIHSEPVNAFARVALQISWTGFELQDDAILPREVLARVLASQILASAAVLFPPD